MLQIVSGKFFKSDKCHETLHRGIYFTNYRSLSNAAFATPLGRLHPSTDRYTSVGTFTYELLERIESESRAPGTLTSTGGRELVESVADVLSFSLRAIWSVDIDVVRRLAPDNSSGPDRPLPQSALRRNFDHRVMSQPEDEALINAFLSELIGLERVSYEAAIRAIRRYVTATHRIADDTNLAYALFVMSIEALAQSAQAPQTTWEDYDETKRGRIDDALHGVPAELAMRVRAAVLRNEHIALGRRFRAFAIEHLSPQFFREEAEAAVAPISRADLDTMLKRAYEIRSGYVHRLQDLPKVLARPIGYVETIEVDGQATLTFEGLARLARHIIFQFVQRGHKVERENFHWRGALPNVTTRHLASQFWIGHADLYAADKARYWLNHFLMQIAAGWQGTSGAVLTDLSAVLDKIEKLPLETVRPRDRRSMLALYDLFLSFAGPTYQQERHREFVKRYKTDFASPSVEELALCLATGREFPWQIDQIEDLYTAYYRQRNQKDPLRLGREFEALLALRLAEINRVADRNGRARELIVLAVEIYPGHSALRTLEAGLGEGRMQPIKPYEILIAKKREDTAASSTPDEQH